MSLRCTRPQLGGGVSARLRAGCGLHLMPRALFDGQHIPEGDKIDEALSKIGDCLVQIGDQSGKLATNLDNFANQVEQAHHHIRDLLNRLGSLSDLGHDLMLIIKGDALEEIKRSPKTSTVYCMTWDARHELQSRW